MGRRAIRLKDSGPSSKAAVGIVASAICLGVLGYGYSNGLVVGWGLEGILWGGLHLFAAASVAASIHSISSLGGPGVSLMVSPAVATPGEEIEVHWAIESEGIDISGIDVDLVEARETLVQGEVRAERDVRKTRIGPAEGEEDHAAGGVTAELPNKLTLDLKSRELRLVWYVEMRLRYTEDGPKRKRLTRRFRVPFEDRL